MILARTLAEHAFDIVVRDLEGFGNRLNDQHRQALRRMLEIYSAMACGEITGRFAFDLATGCGKVCETLFSDQEWEIDPFLQSEAGQLRGWSSEAWQGVSRSPDQRGPAVRRGSSKSLVPYRPCPLRGFLHGPTSTIPLKTLVLVARLSVAL